MNLNYNHFFSSDQFLSLKKSVERELVQLFNWTEIPVRKISQNNLKTFITLFQHIFYYLQYFFKFYQTLY